jgi:hypothetical protein
MDGYSMYAAKVVVGSPPTINYCSSNCSVALLAKGPADVAPWSSCVDGEDGEDNEVKRGLGHAWSLPRGWLNSGERLPVCRVWEQKERLERLSLIITATAGLSIITTATTTNSSSMLVVIFVNLQSQRTQPRPQ